MIGKAIEKFKSDVQLGNLIKSSSMPFVFKIIGLGLSYVFAILLTRHYGAKVFGIYSLSLVVISISSLVSRLGLDSVAVKLVPTFLNTNQKNKVFLFYMKGFLLILFLSTILGVLVNVLSSYISIIGKGDPNLGYYIKILSFSIFPFSLIQFHAEILRGLGKPALQVLFKNLLVPGVGILVLGIGLLFYGMDIKIFQVYLYTTIIVCIISFIFISVIFRSQDAVFSFKKIQTKLPYKEVLKLSLPMFLFSSTLLMSEWINTIMLGYMVSAEDVGVYKVVVRISSLNALTLVTINTVIAPRIASKYAKGDFKALKNEAKKATKLIFWSGLPLQILTFVLGGFLLGIFGSEFSIGLIPLYIILLGELINSLSGPVGQVLNMTNGQVFLGKVSMVRVLLSVMFNILLIPAFGLVGVAISLLIVKTVTNVINVIKVKKELGFYTVVGLN